MPSTSKKFGSGSRPDLAKVNKPKTDHGKMNLFKEGGKMKSDMKQDKAMVKKAVKMHDDQLHGGKKTNLSKLAKGGVTRADGCVSKGHTKGKEIKMCGGGMMKKTGRGR